MKAIIVTTYLTILLICIDFIFGMMSAKNTIENMIGFITLIILIVITVKSKAGLSPYNYFNKKINKKSNEKNN